MISALLATYPGLNGGVNMGISGMLVLRMAEIAAGAIDLARPGRYFDTNITNFHGVCNAKFYQKH